MLEARRYELATARLRRPLDPDAADLLPELVRFATLAVNGHNTQPWRFARTAVGVDIAPDLSRRTPVVDPDDHHLFVSLGAAAENLAITAPSVGRAAAITFNSAHSKLEIALEPQTRRDEPLLNAIPRRRCSRSDYDGRNASTEELSQLEAAAAGFEGVGLRLLTARADLDAVRDLAVEANRAQMADPAFVRELKHWIRFHPKTALARGDGLYSGASGNPTLPDWIAATLFDIVFTVDRETKKLVRQLGSSAGVAVFVADGAGPEHWVKVGRACERFCLRATQLGLQHAFVNQPAEVPALRTHLAAHLGAPDKRPSLVIRFGHGPDFPFSMRRAVMDVLAE